MFRNGLQVPVLLDRIEAGTLLEGIEVVMTYNHRIRKMGMHPYHQITQRTNLLQCTRVSLDTVSIQPTLVADANRILVMPYDMSTDLPQRTTGIDGSIASHPEVVADTLPSLRLVVVVNLLDSVVLIGAKPVAMQHDHSNFSHNNS